MAVIKFISMINYRKTFVILLICSLSTTVLVSCRIYGFHSGYNSLTTEQKGYIIDYTLASDIEGASPGFIYQISAENLQKAMDKYEYNVIYEWAPRCSSENCIPPSIALSEAEKKGYKLWVILDYYDEQIIGTNFNIPIYSIKNTIYNTDYCQKYKRMFLSDLGWQEIDDNWGRFHLFKGREFIAQKNSIPDFSI